jgi:hypothetical protein
MTNITKHTAPTPPTKLEAFLDRLATQLPRSGKLVFAIDATASRQPTWDTACQLQGDMFREAAASGNLEIQLVYYRGPRGECKASGWMTDSKRLATTMAKIVCEGGHTQIGKILSHVRREHDKAPVAALVFLGDAMEEKLDELCALAGKLHTPAFMFQEGEDETAETAFREIARITHGAYARFDAGAADQLRDLLKAVAAYAAGGRLALEKSTNTGAVLLLKQLKS